MDFTERSNRKKSRLLSQATSTKRKSGKGIISKILNGTSEENTASESENGLLSKLFKGSSKDDSPTSYSEWSDNKMISAGETDINSWLRASRKLLNDYNRQAATWHDSDSYDTYHEQINKLMASASNYREQYAGNEEAIAYINDVVNALGKASNAMHDVSKYYAQWETEDDYKEAVKEQKRYEEMMSFDLEAGSAEIDDLEKKLEKAKSFTADDTYYSGNGLGGNVGAQAWNESQQRKSECAKYLKSIGYDSVEDLEAAIAQKKQYLAVAKRSQGKSKLEEDAVNAEDFERYAEQGASIKNPTVDEAAPIVSIFGWKPGAEEVKNKVTYTRDNYEEIFEKMIKAAANGSSYRDDNFNAEYMEMTDDEIKIYNYYLAKYGSSKADKYLDSLTETLRYRAAAKAFDSMKGDTAQEIFFSFGAGLDQFGSGMKALFSDEDYIPPSSIQMRSGMVREDLAGKGPDFLGLGSSLAQTAYDLGTTTSNMLPSIAVSALIGTLNPAVGAATGSALLGTSAAGNAYSEMLNLGYDKDQARAYGSIIGTLEGGLQYVLGGVGKLGGKLTNQAIAKAIEGINSGAAKFAIRYGGEMLSEGIEESLQEILSPIIQNAIFNTDETIDWEQVAYNGLLGALSAGALNSTTAAANVSRENNYYKDVYNADAAEIIAAVLEKDANNKLAKTAQDKLNSGKELSGREIKQLLEQYNKSELSNDKNTIQLAAAEQLAKYGETGNIEAISTAIAKQTAGEALTRSEAKLIEDSKYGQRVANELNPENIRSGEYSSSWAEKLGTNRINAEEYGRLAEEAEREGVPAESANPYNLRPAEELALEPMDYEEQEDYLRERYAEALSDGTMSESFLNTVVSQLKSGRPLVEMIQRTDAYLQRESRAKNAEAAIRNRYADELKSGIVDENAINAMIKEIRSGAALADTIAKMDKNVKETKKYVEQRNDGNSGGVGRDAGAGTSEQSERVPERAEGDKSKERGDDARTEETRRDDSKKPQREKVSSKELNIPGGTENKTLTVVKKPGKVIDRIEKAFSGALKSITFVSGDLEVMNEDGNTVGVSALKTSDDRLFIRTDHRLYSGEKLLLHESGHLYFDEDAELRRAMHNAAAERLTEKRLEQLANRYAQLWWGLYPLPEGVKSSEEVAEYFDNTPDAYQEFLDKYETEIWCDALAGLDRLKAPGASKLSDDVRAIFKKQTGIDVDALLSGQESAETEAKEAKGRAAEVEQHAQSPPGSSYSIETLPDGKKYVRADRQVIFGNDPESWCEQLEDYINGKIRRGKNVQLIAEDGDVLTLTANTAGKIASRYKDAKTMNAQEYERKVNAGVHIDELVRVSTRGKKTMPDVDGRHGEMASGGWNYRTAYFLDFDSEYYRCRISVSIGKDGNAVYNIGEMEERSFPTARNALNGSSANNGALGRETSSQDSIRNSDEVVNSYSVDEDLELNLKLVLEGTFYSDRDEVHIGTTSNFLTREIGAEALELYMPANKAYQAMVTEDTAIFDGKPTGKEINYHGLGIKGLMDILNASENPVAAFADTPSKDNKRENRIVLVTDVKVQGGYGVVIEEMDTFALRNGERKRANKSITAYSKSNIQYAIQDAIADNRILYLDEKRSQARLPIVKGANYPTVGRKADFKDNIRNFWKNVNWKKSGRKNFSAESTSEDLPEWKKQLEKYSENSFSADDAETIAKPETQRITEISSRANAMGINNLRERVALLDGKISGYERTDNLTERMERELEQLRSEREIYEKTLKEKEEKAEKKKQDRKAAKEAAQTAADNLSARYTTRKSRANLRKQIFEIYGIESGRNDVSETLDAFLDVWINQGKISNKAIQRLEDILVDLGEIRVESIDEQAREVRERLNGGRISVPAEVVSEFGDEWDSFRGRAFGSRIYLSTNPSAGYPGIDQWTMDLAASFGRGRFDTDADLKTQLEAIIETAEAGKDEKLTIAQMADYFAQKEGYDFADQYLDEIHDKLMQALKSFSQSAHVEMELIKNSVYRTVKRNEELKQRMEWAQRERDQRELQNKTLKELQWLKRNQRFMGNDFKEEAQRILADIDTIAVHAANEMNWSNKYNATWQDLVTMYKWAKANDPNFLPSKDLEYIVTRIDGLKLEDMTAADLEAVYKAAVALRTAYYNRSNVIGDALHRQFEELFESAVSDLESAAKPKKKVGKTKRFMDSQLNPINRVRRMFGWKQDSAGTQIFGEALEKGERATKRYVEQATQMLDEWLTKNEEWVRKADGQGKDAVWYELEVPELQELHMGDKPIFGDEAKVYMTPMQKVYLYLESKNYDNLRHMVGGRTFVDKELYSAGEYDEAFAGGTTISLAPETVKQIVSDLTTEEMAFANLLDKYFNGYAKEEINRVSNILYGYDRAMSDNYAPIFSNANYTKIEPGVYQDGTAEGVGHMKTRIQGAKNPTYNISALQAFRKHVSQTSRFVGMSIPMQNAKTLLNWKMNGESMQNHITHAWSKAELDALENVMTELQAPTYQQENELTSLLGKAMSNYIGGVFGANITVAAKVLASLPTAAIELGNKYYPTLRQQKNVDLGLIRKYTSELDIRIRGLGSPELAALTLDEGRYQRFVQSHKLTKYMLGGGLLQAVDVYNAKIMWPWAENKVKAEYPGLDVGTDEYYKKVAEVYERAISETQSMYDIMHRSDIMRNTSEIVKSFTIFHTDSLQAANLLRKRAGEYKAAKSEGNSEKTAAAKKALASAVGNSILMNVLVGIFDTLRDLWRKRDDKYRDDEGDFTFWSVTSEELMKLVENASGMIIGLDALIPAVESLFTGETYYEHKVIAIDAFNDIISGTREFAEATTDFISGFADVVNSGGDIWQYLTEQADYRGAVKNAAEGILHYFGGIPVKNIETLITSALGWAWPEVGAAYDGWWNSSSKGDLSKSKHLAVDIKELYDGRFELSDSEAEELARLYESGYKTAIIGDAPSKLGDAELDAADVQAYNNAVKKYLKPLSEIMSSEEYMSASDENKAKMLERLYDYATDLAKGKVSDEHELSSFSLSVMDWLDSGMTWAQIMSGNTADNNTSRNYIQAGVSWDVAEDIIEELSELEPEYGRDKVLTRQKVVAVAYMQISEKEKEGALKVIYGTNAGKSYERYMIARQNGVLTADYADFITALDEVNSDGGNPTKAEFELAVKKSGLKSAAAKEIWYTYFKSQSPWG